MVAKPAARLVRALLLAGGTFVLLVVTAGAARRAGAPAPVLRALPFAVIGAATLLLTRLRGAVDTIVERVTRHREVTPYAALAEAAQHLRSPSPRDAFPGLAQALADGTAADRAAVWLAAGERLVVTASHPATVKAGEPESADSLAALLARPGIGHVVPVLDGGELRAVLTIEKPESPVTQEDRVLMGDVAHGAALLLRAVTLNTELTDRVRRAEHLERELRAARQRLAQAREVERRRLLTELSRATAGRLAALREHVAAARCALGSRGAGAALTRARTEVDELLDRFRVIARGVYPAVLRSQGPAAALEELVADLRRPVRLTGDLDVRMAWQIESAAYQVTAATLDILAAQPADGEIQVRLTRGGSWVRILVEDPSPPVTAAQVRTMLVGDVERLAALGGDVECADGDGTGLRLKAWLPDRLDASVESMT
jgi:signal transduction histidine kinase